MISPTWDDCEFTYHCGRSRQSAGYRVQETPTRGVHLELVQAFDVTDVMDAASARHTTPMTDWPELESEMDRRVYKQLAADIAKTVERNTVEGWSFAAPESIYTKVVQQLPPETRERIVEHVESDLVKLPPHELLSRFRSVQPI